MAGKNKQIFDQLVSPSKGRKALTLDGTEASNDEVFSLRLFINGKRAMSDELTPRQARVFRRTARHLQEYLKVRYARRGRLDVARRAL